MNRNRHCCDGLCQLGRGCPLVDADRVPPLRLAPGVIDGPHRPKQGRIRRTLGRVRRAALNGLVRLVAAVARIVMGACV